MERLLSFSYLSLCTCLMLFLPGVLPAATPSSGTISPTVISVSWQGQMYVLAATADDAACPPASVDSQNAVCDHFFLTVDVDPTFWDNRTGGAAVEITWASSSNDFDLYVFDAEGNFVNSSAQGGTTSEQVVLPKASGTFEVVVVPFTVANSGYAGTATFVADKALAVHTSPNWSTVLHGECCEGNLAAAGSATYVLLPELTTGNDIKRSFDGGKNWEKVYPPADVSVPFGIEGDLRAFGDDVVFFGTEVTHGVAAHSDDRGSNWTIVQIPVAFVVNDQAWLYMGPLSVCPVQIEPYVLAGWFRISSVVLFSCDGGLTWPIQTPLVGVNGNGTIHPVCEATVRDPAPQGDVRVPNSSFARTKAGRHGGWGTDGKFYWTEVVDGELFVCKTDNFGATWEGIRHPLAPDTAEGASFVTTLAFDDRGSLYILHGNKLYVSFDQGESFPFIHTLPRWGTDSSVGDGTAQWFVVHSGTIHVGLKEAASNGTGNIWYLRGKNVDTGHPAWKQELVDNVDPVRLDFMQITVDGNGIPTIGYTTPPDFDKGVTTASRKSAP